MLVCGRGGRVVGVDPLTDLDVFLPSPEGLRLHAIQAALQEGGVPTSDHVHRMLEYLSSESVQYVPFLRIRAMLYAAVARKAAAGQKHPPTTGLVTDVEMVSLLLPYCDAMLVDGEIAGYLKEEPLASSIGFPCKVFSPRTIPQFMTCLDKIETAATPNTSRRSRRSTGRTGRSHSRRSTRQSARRQKPSRGAAPDATSRVPRSP